MPSLLNTTQTISNTTTDVIEYTSDILDVSAYRELFLSVNTTSFSNPDDTGCLITLYRLDVNDIAFPVAGVSISTTSPLIMDCGVGTPNNVVLGDRIKVVLLVAVGVSITTTINIIGSIR